MHFYPFNVFKLIIVIFFNPQIVPNLASGSPFNWFLHPFDVSPPFSVRACLVSGKLDVHLHFPYPHLELAISPDSPSFLQKRIYPSVFKRRKEKNKEKEEEGKCPRSGGQGLAHIVVCVCLHLTNQQFFKKRYVTNIIVLHIRRLHQKSAFEVLPEHGSKSAPQHTPSQPSTVVLK